VYDVYFVATAIAEERPVLAIGWPTVTDPVQCTDAGTLIARVWSGDVVDLRLLEIAALKRLDGIRKIAERRCRRDFYSRALLAEDIATWSLEELRAALREKYQPGGFFEDHFEIDLIARH
jgi:hypothetical protein